MDWCYLFLRFDGRISRKPYWIAFCLLLAAALVSWLIVDHLAGERLADIVNLALIYPEFAVIIKRAHDRETPLWILILYLFLDVLSNILAVLGFAGPIEVMSTPYWLAFFPWLMVGLILLVDLGFRRGIRGPNRFGPDPLEGQL